MFRVGIYKFFLDGIVVFILVWFVMMLFCIICLKKKKKIFVYDGICLKWDLKSN